jgi:hypothetical protein
VNLHAGDRVRYADASATTSTGEPVIVDGTVNGVPLDHDGVRYWPVWSQRDNGREATTVYVHEGNILGRTEAAP